MLLCVRVSHGYIDKTMKRNSPSISMRELMRSNYQGGELIRTSAVTTIT